MKDRIFEGLRQFFTAFITFFLVVSFTVTSSFLLFLDDFDLPMELLPHAAKITFANTILFSLMFVIIDIVRRKLTIGRPVQEISKALEQVMAGDFSVRLRPTGHYTGFAEIMRSINRMTEELSGVETLRTDFISSVSHEMKTPLAVIQNYCTLLQSPDLTEAERAEYTDTIFRECRRLSNLITNILKLNKLENQQLFPQAESYDLAEQLRECLLMFEPVWEEKDLNIHADLPDTLHITAEKELLWLVWSNLLSNAFKFTDRGSVSVTLSATDTHAVVTVSDTGCGMSPEVGKRIFEKFYQGDSSHATEGNGLGLALVKRIIHIAGSEISVSSTVGTGSSFTVRLRRSI